MNLRIRDDITVANVISTLRSIYDPTYPNQFGSNKIGAIKMARMIFNLGLKEAKDWVESGYSLFKVGDEVHVSGWVYPTGKILGIDGQEVWIRSLRTGYSSVVFLSNLRPLNGGARLSDIFPTNQ